MTLKLRQDGEIKHLNDVAAAFYKGDNDGVTVRVHVTTDFAGGKILISGAPHSGGTHRYEIDEYDNFDGDMAAFVTAKVAARL